MRTLKKDEIGRIYNSNASTRKCSLHCVCVCAGFCGMSTRLHVIIICIHITFVMCVGRQKWSVALSPIYPFFFLLHVISFFEPNFRLSTTTKTYSSTVLPVHNINTKRFLYTLQIVECNVRLSFVSFQSIFRFIFAHKSMLIGIFSIVEAYHLHGVSVYQTTTLNRFILVWGRFKIKSTPFSLESLFFAAPSRHNRTY